MRDDCRPEPNQEVTVRGKRYRDNGMKVTV